MRTFLFIAAGVSFFNGVFSYTSGITYNLVKDYQAGTSSFFNNFNFYTGADPTHGFVQYQPQSSAPVWTVSGASFVSANYWSYASAGRPSTRLESKTAYTEVLIITEFNHVPGGQCGVWPAFWTANLTNWPNGGEIDILEGVNTQTNNHFAFHTSNGCTVSGQSQSGSLDTSNCYVNAAGQSSNAGCGGSAATSKGYGNGMNAIGGGIYAMDWRKEGIRIWFFPKGSYPADIVAGKPAISGWGTPMADLPSKGCNIPNHFMGHQIIFDITFCGDWAGAVYAADGCPGTCTNQVAWYPSSFNQAYFGVKSLKVYKSTTPI